MHEQIVMFAVKIGSSVHRSETMHGNKILCLLILCLLDRASSLYLRKEKKPT